MRVRELFYNIEFVNPAERTRFFVFPISTRVDVTVYQHGKCFIVLGYNIKSDFRGIYLSLVPFGGGFQTRIYRLQRFEVRFFDVASQVSSNHLFKVTTGVRKPT